MKKKILVLSIVIILLTTAVVGGSLAWFTDSDTDVNTFTVGSVDIVQHEQFNPNQAILMPVTSDTPSVEANYIEKKVTVENIGKNDAYIQTFVAVPKVLDDAGVLKIWDASCQTNGWTKDAAALGTATIGTQVYNVYRYRYNSKLLVGSERTAPCLEYVYIDKKADVKGYDDNQNGTTDRAHFVNANGTEITAFDIKTHSLDVYVVTQAVQAEGFTDAANALDSAFGVGAIPTTWN